MSARDVGRRAVAGSGLAMLVLAAAAAGSAKEEELDGELLARCAEFRDLDNELERINDVLGDMLMVERDAHPLAQRETEASERYCELRELIADTAARTPEGIQAKAHIVLAEFRGEDNSGDFPGQYDPRGALALFLACDLIGRAG